MRNSRTNGSKNIELKYKTLQPVMNEQMRRLWAATEAKLIGRGGISEVSRATGLARNTIAGGILELELLKTEASNKKKSHNDLIRRRGGGRKCLNDKIPMLTAQLEELVEPATRGDPESPLRWTCKSTRKLSEELKRRGFNAGYRTVCRLLKNLDYSLQAPSKTHEGGRHPDRNAQFEYISNRVLDFQRRGQPVVSVDAKKKENVGDFKNGGREWRPKGSPEKVRVYDFVDKELGKALPYGVYDITLNRGWVSVGIDHDTADFAVETLRRWWNTMGKALYPKAEEIMITADGGGSNGSRNRLWKVAIQKLADDVHLKISICHFPPGTSKWNKIEHRMFSHITKNWRGRSLESLEIIVNLIGSTTTATGLKINAELDTNSYETGIKIRDKELATLQIEGAEFHGEWNYTIIPKT